MILYIHGFGSCGWGEKSLLLRRHFGVAGLLAPDLPYHPARALQHLRATIARQHVEAMIGSSLGGYYATYLNAEFRMPAVLINPVVAPAELLHDYRGRQRRWCDDAQFEVDDDYVTTLRKLQRNTLTDREPYLVLVQRGDEVLDYRQAVTFYRDKDVIEIDGGDHRFRHLHRQLPRIGAWLAEQSRLPDGEQKS